MAAASKGRSARRVGMAVAVAAAGLIAVLGGQGRAGLRGVLPAADPLLTDPLVALPRAVSPAPEDDGPATPARIVLGPGGRDVRLMGELDDGASGRLARLLEDNPGVERIHLTSEGGLVDEGSAIGDLIARHGLVTYVPDYCVSACTLAFVRGRERLMVAAGRLGFHAPYEADWFGREVQADAAPERAAYVAAGVAPDFAEAALAIPSSEIWIPDADRLLQAGVLTGVVDSHRFPDSTLDDGDDLPHARAAILRNLALLRGLDAVAPRLVDGIAGWYLDAYRAGRSEGEALAGLRRLTARQVARVVRAADDDTVTLFGRTLARALERAPLASCAAIAEGDLVLAQEVLGEDDTATVVAGLAQAASLSGPDTLPSEAGPVRTAECEAMRAAYGQALARPVPEAATALRRLIAPTLPSRVQEATARP